MYLCVADQEWKFYGYMCATSYLIAYPIIYVSTALVPYFKDNEMDVNQQMCLGRDLADK